MKRPSSNLLARWRGDASVAVLTGAGISAESGLPTFRGVGGWWKNYRAEDLATPEAFQNALAAVDNSQLIWRSKFTTGIRGILKVWLRP